MAKRIWPEPSTFPEPDIEPKESIWCIWPGCQLKRWKDIPICRVHAEMTARRTQEEPELDPEVVANAWQMLTAARNRPPRPSVVYYLLVKPGVVKIGYSGDFLSRLRSLRCDLGDLLALEIGGREEEQKRHRQFDGDRLIRNREDFAYSSELQNHIESLRPQREELLKRVRPHWLSDD